MNTYAVCCSTRPVEVWREGRVLLAENGETGDAAQSIVYAVTTDGRPVLLLTTNGDDSLLAWLGEGEDAIALDPDVTPGWLETFAMLDSTELEGWLLDLAENMEGLLAHLP